VDGVGGAEDGAGSAVDAGGAADAGVGDRTVALVGGPGVQGVSTEFGHDRARPGTLVVRAALLGRG